MDISKIVLFPLSEYWWFYLAFTGMVVGLLVLDLGIFHRNPHRVSFREAGFWTIFWVSLALIFNYGFYQYALWKFAHDPRLLAIPGFEPIKAAQEVALQFLAGYIVEESLSVDNLFVFVMVFAYFAIPQHLQHRILFYGILGAIIFRGIFIALGAALIQYKFVVYIFGIFLVFSGIKMLTSKEDEEINPEKNIVIQLVKRVLPVTTLQEQRFFITHQGVLHATPLFIVLLFVEMTDIIFAVDSVPAIFAVTKEPLIVFTSNIFAILGLRSIYFMLANAVDKFYLLRYGLSLVLIFVGLKMTFLHEIVTITVSLGIILALLILSILLSLIFPKKPKEEITET
jgi:tellurite resistance protein TerC